MKTMHPIVVALLATSAISCSETHYYIFRDAEESTGGGGDGGGHPSSSGNGDSVAATSTGAHGGMTGSAGSVGATSSSIASTSASVSSVASASSGGAASMSSSTGGPPLPDCSDMDSEFGDPCDGGVCARDETCRSLARCTLSGDNWTHTIDCEDRNVRYIAVWEQGLGFIRGCSHAPGAGTYRPVSCVPGDRCSVGLSDWSVLPEEVGEGNEGVCE